MLSASIPAPRINPNQEVNIETKYLRPKKAALLAERYRMYASPPEACITEVADGCIIPAYTDSHGDAIAGVIDRGGRFVSGSFMVDYPAEVEAHASGVTWEAAGGETVAYLGMFNPHWGHFITDCLASFWFLGEIEADRYLFSYYDGQTPEIHPNIRQALTLLGVWDKVEIVNTPRRYRRVYVPTIGMVPRGHALDRCAAVYRTIISRTLESYSQPAEPHDKILLSRSKFPKARLNDLGISLVEQLFVDNGYYPVYPERMTLIDLIGTLAAAKEVVTSSGTPAHNMLFAPEGTHTIVIEKHPCINNYQQGIDRLKHLNVTYIDAAYAVWPIDPGLGPFIMAYTPELRQFAADRGLTCPRNPFHPRKTLRRFFSLYYRHYKRKWIMPEWLEPEIHLFNEAYQASLPLFGPWLDGTRPLFLTDLLHPRTLAKHLLPHPKK